MYQEMRSESLPSRTDVRWFHTETVADATSNPLMVPAVDRPVAIVVTPGASARVEYTLSGYAAVIDGAGTWLPWPAGDVSDPTGDSAVGAVTALRLVSTGASTWEVTL